MLLKKGNNGEEVRKLQSKLISLGYSCGASGADGDFGQGTYNAVVKFQNEHGLGADGIVGPATMDALNNSTSGSGTFLKKGSNGEQVRKLQSKLISLGYSCGASGADGDFGQGTYNAVVKFQNEHGLGADGIVGPATMDALNNSTSGSGTGGSTGISNGSVSGNLVDFVKSYEGFFDHAYDDGTGVMTIGYGTIRSDRVALGHCTEAQARAWLMEEINAMASQVNSDLSSKGISLKQNEFDSLCSFAYNCGVHGLLKESTLYNRVCQGVRDESLRQNFLAWTHGGGNVMQGLVRRRNAECDIFLHATYKNN